MTHLSLTQAAARCQLSPADFNRLRRTYPLSSVEGKGGPQFDPESLDRWWDRLPVRQLITGRKTFETQTRQKERDRNLLMRLWDYLRRIVPPLGALKARFILTGSHFTLFDHRGETRWSSLSEAIDGMRLALSLARTRSAAVLKAA